jgi:DNA-binding GntR family transcriptional regulator
VGEDDARGIEYVHDYVRRAILNGDFAPNEQLSQVQIAKELGVSRTPLREALRLLEREGLVETQTHRKARVAGISVEDLEETYMARIVLEGMAIRLTVPTMTTEDLAQLEAEMGRMAHFADQADLDRWERPHKEFHMLLVRAAGGRLIALMSQLSDHCERYRRMHSLTPNVLGAVLKEHRAIIDACKARDPDRAAAALVDHLSRVVFDLLEVINPDYDPERLRLAVRLAHDPIFGA